MKTINKLSFLLASCFLLCLSGCYEHEDYGSEIQDGKLELKFQVVGGMQVSTYGIPGETHENKIDEVYTLFFNSSSHATNANAYVGYTRTNVSASTAAGTARVSLPQGVKLNEEYQLIFLANFKDNAFLDGESGVADLLDNKVAYKTYTEALQYLQVTSTGDTPPRMGSPLAMSAQIDKAADAKSVDVRFKRRMARVDLNNSATSNFKLVSVRVWNAREQGYMFDSEEGGSAVPDDGSIIKTYDDPVVVADGDVEVKGRLYAYPNFVEAPEIGDEKTTCLIIGGKYDNSATTTYYRVNVCPAESQQVLEANGAYIINITKVHSAGEDTEEGAYQGPLKMDYEINEWDDEFLGIYVFDKDGNGLAVSQRKVIFSKEAGQSVQLEVFKIKGPKNPLTEDWVVQPLTGTDAVHFSTNKDAPVGDREYITVSTVTENDTPLNRNATFDVTWGNIKIEISLVQLTPGCLSSMITLVPDTLIYYMDADTKQICLNLQGDFTGITREHIKEAIIYADSNSGWLTLTKNTAKDDPSAGVYYYNVAATKFAAGGERLANLKFVVTQGDVIMTAQAPVKQMAFVRNLSINLLERDKEDTSQYNDKGDMFANANLIKGLPEETRGTNHLHFAFTEHEQVKYELTLKASENWTIVHDGSALCTALSFGATEGAADVETTFELSVTEDCDMSGREGAFYIKYANGEQDEFYVHQHGVYSTLGRYRVTGSTTALSEDKDIYYYGAFKIGEWLWLDRNLGATIGQNVEVGADEKASSEGYYSIIHHSKNSEEYKGRGRHFMWAAAEIACPPGFRLPTGDKSDGSGEGEWDWIYRNTISSGVEGDPAPGFDELHIFCVVDATSTPKRKWMLPHSEAAKYKDWISFEGSTSYYWATSHREEDSDPIKFFHMTFRYNGQVDPPVYKAELDIFGAAEGWTAGYSVRCIQDK